MAKTWLAGIVDLRGLVSPHLLELGDDRAGVVVGHHMLGADRDEVAGVDRFAGLETHGESCGEFLDEGQRLRHVGILPHAIQGLRRLKTARSVPVVEAHVIVHVQHRRVRALIAVGVAVARGESGC
jgi:hypothetical protein